MADLPGHSIAIPKTCMTKIEAFDEIGIRDKHNFENESLEIFFPLLEEIITKMENQIFRGTTICISKKKKEQQQQN